MEPSHHHCDCNRPGYCERHQCYQSPHHWRLCRTQPTYFEQMERQCARTAGGQAATPAPEIAPLRGVSFRSKPWEGSCPKKPWDYSITAVIPVLDTPEPLRVAVDVLRCQTNRPYIIIIDTGTQPSILSEIESLRADDLEVHLLRLNGVRHPSDFPAMAMDLAFAICRTPLLFATHADCFLRKQSLLQEMADLCGAEHPVVGYELSPRKHPDWKGMFGHTCTMFDMRVMDRIGAGWSMRRLATLYGMEHHEPHSDRPNWPDTELLLNYLVREHGIEPLLIGHEENFIRNKDDNIDHCRSLTGAMLYNPAHYEKASRWAAEAMSEARQRLQLWRSEP